MGVFSFSGRPPSLCHPLAQLWGARVTVPAGGTVETLPTGDPAPGPRPCVTRSHSHGVRARLSQRVAQWKRYRQGFRLG